MFSKTFFATTTIILLFSLFLTTGIEAKALIENNNNPATLTVASVQIFPIIVKNDPLQTVKQTSNKVMQVLLDAQQKQKHDLFVLPEFLFGGGQDSLKKGVCSGDGTNHTGTLGTYAFPVPAANESLNCASGLPLESPHRIVGCEMLGRGHGNLTISLNVIEVVANGSLYNTQVVVRNGFVIARYRKFHPFFTTCFTKPNLELVTFDLYGRRFGIFTCYDILWKNPKMDLVHMGVKYFSYSMSMPEGILAVEVFSGAEKVVMVNSNAAPASTAVVIDGKPVNRCPNKEVTCISTATIQ